MQAVLSQEMRQCFLVSMTDYLCGKCNANVRPDDNTCSHCGADLSQVGRKIMVVLDEPAIGVSDQLITVRVGDEFTALSPNEKSLFYRLYDWLVENWTLDQIEVGFPSGVNFVFKRRSRPNQH